MNRRCSHRYNRSFFVVLFPCIRVSTATMGLVGHHIFDVMKNCAKTFLRKFELGKIICKEKTKVNKFLQRSRRLSHWIWNIKINVCVYFVCVFFHKFTRLLKSHLFLVEYFVETHKVIAVLIWVIELYVCYTCTESDVGFTLKVRQ